MKIPEHLSLSSIFHTQINYCLSCQISPTEQVNRVNWKYGPHFLALRLHIEKHNTYTLIMKKIISPLMALLLLLGISTTTVEAQIQTPRPSPMSKVEQEVGLSTISLDYSRPSMKGRTIFGDLVPYGQIWRTGANQATKITFSDDATFGGKAVKAGTYALYTMPGKTSWTVMLYNDLSLGGNVAGYDESKEVARFTIAPEALPFEVETFTLGFNNLTDTGASMVLYWEKTILNIPITLEVEKAVMASIERTMAGPSANDYRAAAVYYYTNGKDLDQALKWIDMALAGGERYWIVTDKARILAKMGKKAEATAASQKAIALAKEAKNMDYVKINEDIIAGLK